MKFARLWLIALFIVFGTAAAVPAAAQSSPAGQQRWALLVGVDNYESRRVNDLLFAVRDVNAVADALVQKAGFAAGNVVRLTTGKDAPAELRPTPTAILRQLDALSRKVAPEDTFVFYFSGHGFSRGEGQHYLGTVNADPTSQKSLETTTLPLTALRQKIAGIKARKVFFLIDACRNDPGKGEDDGAALSTMTQAFSRDFIRTAKSAAGGLAGSAVLFACSEGERAWEAPEKRHGIFTYYLLEGLSGKAAEPNGEMTVAGLADYVQQQVVRWADEQEREQTPDLRLDGAARIVLGVSASPPKPVSASAAETHRILRQMQDLLGEHGIGRTNIGMIQKQFLFTDNDRLHTIARWHGKVAGKTPVATNVAIASLDAGQVAFRPAGRESFRIMAGTRPGAERVLVRRRDGGRKNPNTSFGFFIRGEENARQAARLLREYIAAAQRSGGSGAGVGIGSPGVLRSGED